MTSKNNKKVKPVKKEELATYLEESRGLERDLLSEFGKSRRRGWLVGGAGLVFGIFGFATAMVAVSQEVPPPLVLRVDNATGAIDQVTAMQVHEASYGEIVDEYWLNQFILNRESYDYHTIQQNYETTALLSAPEVQREYYELFNGPNALDVTLSNRARIKVKIKSIQPNNQGQATVRFTTTEIRDNGTVPMAQDWIATIAYRYVQGPMNRSDRRVNPLGFQVTSYRADPELIR